MSLWCTQGHLAWQQRIEKEITAASRTITNPNFSDPDRLDELRNTLRNKKTERTVRRSMDLDSTSNPSNRDSHHSGSKPRDGSLPSISRHSRYTSSSKVESLLEKLSSSTKSSISQHTNQEPEELLKLKKQLYQEKKMRKTIEEELKQLKDLYYKQ